MKIPKISIGLKEKLPSDNKWLIFGTVILTSIIIYILCLNLTNHNKTTIIDNTKTYSDSIKNLNLKNKILNQINDSIIEYNSYLTIQSKQIVKTYEKQYHFIKGATASELDSILRINW